MTKARLLKRLETHAAEQEQRDDVRDVRVHVDGDSAIIHNSWDGRLTGVI